MVTIAMTDNDSTKLLQDKTAVYEMDESLAQLEESCPNCSLQIPIGEQFCPNCGYQRGTWGGEAGLDSGTVAEAVTALYILSGDAGEFPIGEGTTVIGRGDAGIQIPDGYMSRKHAEFRADGESLTVTDLGSSNGTYIGETQLAPDEPTELADGMAVRFGQSAFTISKVEISESGADEDTAETADSETETEADDGAAEPVEAETNPDADAEQQELSAWSISGGGLDVQLPLGMTTFGRKADKCDVVIEGDGFISGLHFSITVTESGVTLEDAGSTNGTTLNGDKLEPGVSADIENGQSFIAGQTELMLNLSEMMDDPPDQEDQAEATDESGPGESEEATTD